MTFTRLAFWGFLSSSSAGLYLHHNEWVDNYLATMTTIALMMVLFRKTHFSHEGQGLIGEPSTVFLCALSLGILASSHISLALIGMLHLAFVLLGNCLVSNNYRRTVVFTYRNHKLRAFLMFSGSFLVLLTSSLDLWKSTGRELFSDTKYVDLLGTYGDGWLTGVSEGHVPPIVESTVALLVTVSLLPLIILLAKVLPNSVIQDQLAEAFPRAEFGGFMVLIIAVYLSRRGRMSPANRELVCGICLGMTTSAALVLAGTYDFVVPRQIVPSGGFLLFPFLIVSSVFLTIILYEANPANGIWVRRGLRINFFTVLVWTLLQVGFGRNSDQLLPIVAQQKSWYLNNSSYQEIARILEAPGRSIALGSPQFFANNAANLIALPMTGKPLIAPSAPKTRSLRHLVSHNSLDSAVGVWNPDSISFEELDSILDFLEVQYVITAQNDPIIGLYTLDESSSDRQLVDSNLKLQDSNYLVWRRNRFTNSQINETLNSTDTCPVLSGSCLITSRLLQIDPSTEPRLKTCETSCLWTYRSTTASISPKILIPVTYDGVLRVSSSEGVSLPTSNFGGFLSVDLLGNKQENLTISVSPDFVMWLRVFSSYWNLALVSLLGIIVCVRKTRICTHNNVRTSGEIIATNSI